MLVRNVDLFHVWHFATSITIPKILGLLSRAAAEELLKNKKQGDFLIRVSDKVWGYALSYK